MPPLVVVRSVAQTCQVVARGVSGPSTMSWHGSSATIDTRASTTVDAYSLQHPDKYMRSGKSYAAHLTGMYAALKGEFTAEVHRAVQQWLNGSKALQRPDHPAAGQRGALTIVHVLEAKGPDVQRVREWAASVWEAWRGYRPIAQQWIDAAGTSQEAFQRRRAARRQPARGGRETVCE